MALHVRDAKRGGWYCLCGKRCRSRLGLVLHYKAVRRASTAAEETTE